MLRASIHSAPGTQPLGLPALRLAEAGKGPTPLPAQDPSWRMLATKLLCCVNACASWLYTRTHLECQQHRAPTPGTELVPLPNLMMGMSAQAGGCPDSGRWCGRSSRVPSGVRPQKQSFARDYFFNPAPILTHNTHSQPLLQKQGWAVFFCHGPLQKYLMWPRATLEGAGPQAEGVRP